MASVRSFLSEMHAEWRPGRAQEIWVQIFTSESLFDPEYILAFVPTDED